MGSSSKKATTTMSTSSSSKEQSNSNNNDNKNTDNNNNTSNDISKIVWTTVPIKNNKNIIKTKNDVDDDDGCDVVMSSTIQVTNKDVVNVLPKSGLNVIDDFVSPNEVLQLLHEIDTHDQHGTNKFQWEGFERRRKVQRYTTVGVVSSKTSEEEQEQQQQQHLLLPGTTNTILQMLINRIYDKTGYSTTHVTIEEYPLNQLSKYLQTNKTTVTTFESNTTCRKCYKKNVDDDDDNDDDDKRRNCCCFVGQIAICVPVVEYINRPQQDRITDCWNLYTKHSWTGLRLDSRSLYLKSNDFLWYWRCRITSVAAEVAEEVAAVDKETKNDTNDDDDADDADGTTKSSNGDVGGGSSTDHNKRRIILIKFSNIPDNNSNRCTNDNGEATTTTAPLDDMNTLLPLNNNGGGGGGGSSADPSSTSDSLPKNLVEDDLSSNSPDGSGNSNNKNDENENEKSLLLLYEEVNMPPLEDILTIIVTTSPIKSNPSTELLEKTFSTFPNGGPEFAYKCRKLIVCDGCRTRNSTVTKRHVNDKQSMRNGIVTSTQAQNYEEFKRRLRILCNEAANTTNTKTTGTGTGRGELSSTTTTTTTPSPFCNAVVEELDTRMGYGYALRHALYNCVKTPYVIVIQHDRTIMRPTPILETVRAMWYDRHYHNRGRNNKIKYVGISMRSNLLYRDIFSGKYGKKYVNDMSRAVLRPPELALDAALYGPNSHSTKNMLYGENDKLRDNIDALIETYRGSQQYTDHLEWLESTTTTATATDDDEEEEEDDASIGGGDGSKKPNKIAQLSLTPTFFWYDNVHICETAHYRDFIFHPSYKMVAPGGFVEDKVSPVIKKSVERFGLIEGHARFGCYLLDDHSGMFFTGKFNLTKRDGGTNTRKEPSQYSFFLTGHLDGGSYITVEEKQAILKASEKKKLACALRQYEN